MAIETIIAHLDAEIAKLKQARNLLSNTGKVEGALTPAKRGRPAKNTRGTVKKAKVVKRVLSPEARKAIGDAQRRRWSAQKANKK
jgi:hypothetical protein